MEKARMENRFAPALRRLDRELDLPTPIRTEILLEMAADLDAVYAHHRAAGRSDAEATQLAEASVLGSSEVVRRLGQLHRGGGPSWTRVLADRLGDGLRGVDLVLLVLGVLPVLAVAAAGSVSAPASSPTDPLAWLLAGLGSAIAAVGTGEVLRLRRLDRCDDNRLSALLVLATLAPAAGLLSAAVSVHGGFTRAAAGGNAGGLEGPGTEGVAVAEGMPAALWTADLAEPIASAAAMLSTGLLVGLAGGLAWFGLIRASGRRAARRLDAILTVPDRSPSPSRPGSGHVRGDGDPAMADVVPLVPRRS